MMKQPYADALSAHALFGRLVNGKYALRNLDDDDVRFYAITGESPRRLYELTGGAGDFKFQRIYRSVQRLLRPPGRALVEACGERGARRLLPHRPRQGGDGARGRGGEDRKSTRLNSSH